MGPKTALGIGFSSRCTTEELLALARDVLARAEGASPCWLATVTPKQNAPQLRQLAEALQLTPCHFPAEALAEQPVNTPSDKARQALGTPSVAEAAALAAVGPGSRLVVNRQTSPLASCALAVGSTTQETTR